MGEYTVLPRCYALLAVTPPPPPIFGRNEGYFTSITPPRDLLEPVCGTAVLARVRVLQLASVEDVCIKHVENSLRNVLGLFH